MFDFKHLEATIIEKDLCTICGSCIGICPKGILTYDKRKERIVLQNGKQCISCGKCANVCPGGGVNFKERTEELFDVSYDNLDKRVGYCEQILAGYAQDATVYEEASSGGIATAIALYLLETQKIDGVIGITSTGQCVDVRVLRNRAEVLSAAQSKYVFVPTNQILSTLTKLEGRYLFIGLPCQIQGLRNAMKLDQQLRGKIYMCIGIFCGFNMSTKATEFLIQKSKIPPEEIIDIQYRGRQNGETGFKIIGKHKTFFIPKHGYTILNLFYSPQRCWKCFDLTSEFADISLGDAWEMQPSGSRILCRTAQAVELINQMQCAGLISTTASSIDDMLATQGKLLRYKKGDIYSRLKQLKNPPNYGFSEAEPSSSQLRAKLFTYCLLFGQTKFAHLCLQLVPIALLSGISKFLRGGNAKSREKKLEIIRYAFWGGLTVIVSFLSYTALLYCQLPYQIANIISIVLTKVFAYITNKKFVFHRKCTNSKELLSEMMKFIVARGASGVVEFIGLCVLVDVCSVNKLFGKGLMIVITTIMNYWSGKNHVFKSKQ